MMMAERVLESKYKIITLTKFDTFVFMGKGNLRKEVFGSMHNDHFYTLSVSLYQCSIGLVLYCSSFTYVQDDQLPVLNLPKS